MEQKQELTFLVGGVVVVGVLIFAMSSKKGGSGLSYIAPNAQSVAAVENANTAIAQSLNQTVLAKSQTGANLIGLLDTNRTQLTGLQDTNASHVAMNSSDNASSLATSLASFNSATTINAANNRELLAVAKDTNATVLGQTKLNANSAYEIAVAQVKGLLGMSNDQRDVGIANANSSRDIGLAGADAAKSIGLADSASRTSVGLADAQAVIRQSADKTTAAVNASNQDRSKNSSNNLTSFASNLVNGLLTFFGGKK